MAWSVGLFTVPVMERFGRSDVIKFKLNTTDVSGDDVISARLGVYVRPSHQRRQWGSSPRRHSGGGPSPLVRVHVRDVTWPSEVFRLRRRTVYNVGSRGQWLVFEVRYVQDAEIGQIQQLGPTQFCQKSHTFLI